MHIDSAEQKKYGKYNTLDKRLCKVYLQKIGDTKIKETIPPYIIVTYSYISYMNRRSNGAMFPIVAVYRYCHFYECLDDIIRLYRTYKDYTFMYSNITEENFQRAEKVYSFYDSDLENLRYNGFQFELESEYNEQEKRKNESK